MLSTVHNASPAEVAYRRDLRAALARELHDGPIRELNNSVVRLESFRTVSDSPDMQVAITVIEEHVRAALKSLRNVIGELRDEAPQEDLAVAIKSMIDGYRKSTPSDFTLVISPSWPELVPARIALHLMRIVQEAVQNAIRHGRPRHILLELQADPERLEVRVSDDGSGIGSGLPEGAGILGMRERATPLGGGLTVRHRHPGTEIHVQAPLR
jgi:signal transduction histidine kinase